MTVSRTESGDPSTIGLLERARLGDSAALNLLLSRYIPRLRGWARGRLPHRLRDLADTDDLVQEVLLRTIRRIDRFTPHGDGSFDIYVRQALWNRIRDEIRAASRRAPSAGLDQELEDVRPSPVEAAIGREALERYEQALAQLSDEERQALVGRFELGYDYRELAGALGKFTPDAARKLVQRGLVRLTELMSRGR